MGWFSSEDIIAPVVSSNVNEGHQTAQSVSLCVIAAIAAGYIVIKSIIKLHRNHTERVAERAARRVAVQV